MKPTILAFHGSGSNAMVHTVQLARLNRVIGDDFNIESMEGTSIVTSIPPPIRPSSSHCPAYLTIPYFSFFNLPPYTSTFLSSTKYRM